MKRWIPYYIFLFFLDSCSKRYPNDLNKRIGEQEKSACFMKAFLAEHPRAGRVKIKATFGSGFLY